MTNSPMYKRTSRIIGAKYGNTKRILSKNSPYCKLYEWLNSVLYPLQRFRQTVNHVVSRNGARKASEHRAAAPT